jgi:hypothetical protein
VSVRIILWHRITRHCDVSGEYEMVSGINASYFGLGCGRGASHVEHNGQYWLQGIFMNRL